MINIKIERFDQIFAENMVAELKDVVSRNHTLPDDRRRDLQDFLDGLMYKVQNPECPACGAKGSAPCTPTGTRELHIPATERTRGLRTFLHDYVDTSEEASEVAYQVRHRPFRPRGEITDE
jgi:hypothetical protein